MEKKHSKRDELKQSITHIINTIVHDLQGLSTIVRSHSKKAVEANNSIINQLLLTNIEDTMEIARRLLTHLIQIIGIVAIKAMQLTIVSKVISLIKILCQSQRGQDVERKEGVMVIKQIVDIVDVLSQRKSEEDMCLRIVQTSYSLIEPDLLQFADYSLITRLYSIFLKYCSATNPMIQNITASAIFALTEISFPLLNLEDLSKILVELLEFTIKLKKCQWLKQNQLKSITWDVILISVKTIPLKCWEILAQNKKIVEILNEMYILSIENFSIHLSIELKQEDQIVNFRKHINIFHILYDYQRTNRFYVILEGICLIIKHGSFLVLEEQSGIMLIDIFQKVCEDLYSSKVPLHISWEGSELRIQKIFDDFSHITDEDYLKLIKNTLINLRKGLQTPRKIVSQKNHLDESLELSTSLPINQKNDHKDTSQAYRWRRLIKSIIRIVKYLTSLKFKEGSNDQVIRKFIMELQFWFMICPTNKTRNSILLELQQSTNHIETLNQAIKASQCMQICSNILFGFYSMLNSVGVSIIIRILANIKINVDSGRDFYQLQEVCEMGDRFYIEQKLISNQTEFKITLEGFMQCLNLITADMQIPLSNGHNKSKEDKHSTQKYLKLIQYVLFKFKFVIEQNSEYLQTHWNFIECFWISLCTNKLPAVRDQIKEHMTQVVPILLKQKMLQETQIIHLYLQLSRFQLLQISKMVIQQIKMIVSYLKDQSALVEVFSVLKELSTKKYKDGTLGQVYQMEQMLIKEYLFRVTSQQNLLQIMKSLDFQGKDKNQEYKTVSILWNVSDHLKLLYQKNPEQSQSDIWKYFFNKINHFARTTTHPGTRQACIHTFTQTIATSLEAIGQQLFLQLISNEYMNLFGLLMGFNQEVQVLDAISKIQMQKMAIKNFMKLTNKCINDKDPDLDKIVQKVINNLITFMSQSGKDQSIEYFIQLCQLFTYFKEIYQQKIQQKIEMVDIVKIKEALRVIQIQHQFLDKSTYYWKSKYLPTFNELKEYFYGQ